MKSKFGLFSAFAAFACVLASGFAWGETVILRHQGLPDEYYADLQKAIDAAKADDFVVLRSDVARELTITNKTCLYVESCSIGLRYANKPAKFTISKGGSLELRNDAASTNSSFYGQIDVKDGSLVLNGVTCYATNDGAPILVTEGVSNCVEVTASKFYSSGKSVFELNGGGTVSVKGKSVLSFDSSATTYDPEVAIRMLRGDLVVDDSLLRAKTTCVFIGTEAYDAPAGDVSCRIVNGAELKSGWDCVCAIAGKVNIEVHDSNLSARNDGVRLFADGSSIDGKSKVTLDGATTITTAESDYAYAIENGSPEKWVVEIVSGTYYRMKKSISKDWISLSSEATWDPAGQDDGLRLTVVNSGERKVEYVVSFDFNISGIASQTNSYRVPYGESLNVADITPAEDFAVTNDYGIFAGWYYTADDAKVFSNKVPSVSTSTNLVAGWKKAAATFHRNYDADGKTTNYFGLAKYVNEGESKIDFGQLFPRQMGWDDPKYSFEEWQNDKDAECHVLPYPMTNEDVHIYAKWSSKAVDDVFKVGNTFYSSFDEAVRDANNGQKPILLVENLDQGLSFMNISNVAACLDLNGYSVGASGHELDCAIAVSNSTLRIIDGRGGVVYGQIKLLSDAFVSLEGGKFLCSSNNAVSADGDGYTFMANGVEIVGGASETGGVVEFYGNTGNLACISNSTISSVSKDVDSSVGVTICGCEVELANAQVTAVGKGVDIISCCNDSAIVDTTNALNIVAGSKITARYGVFAEPSDICVQESTVASEDMGGYAFFLKDGKGGAGALSLGAENNVIGGMLTDKGTVSGGFLRTDVNWGESIEIVGGTYAHVASNTFSSAWIASGCEVKWLSPTSFTVTNPQEIEYTITYDLRTNLPSEAQAAVDAGTAKFANPNPTNYLTSTSIPKFKSASCFDQDGYGCQTEGWYLSDDASLRPVLGGLRRSSGTEPQEVIAISNGYVVVKVDGKPTVTDITGDLVLVAKWGEWAVVPYTVGFASGVVIKDVDEDDPEIVDYHEVELWDDDDMKANGVAIAEDFPVGGLEYYAGGKPITLPSGITWEGHTLSGWAAYDSDDFTDPENPPELLAEFAPGEVPLKDFVYQYGDRKGEALDDGVTLHAVWDQGGGDEDWANFENMYNGERDKIMTGGDTYVGYISDNGQVIGKIVVKLGTPNKDGSIKVSATVTINGEGSKSFRGRGEYHGDYVYVSLENGEDQLDLTLDSKTIQGGSYNGYDVVGGVNLFKGSAADKQRADEAVSPFLGRWLFVFSTVDAWEDARDKHGEVRETDVENADAHAWGHSYVEMDVRNEGKVKLSGKLANGEDISATATAIIGDNLMCIPATCSVYSGKRGGGFGFTAYFKSSGEGSNVTCLAAVDTNSVSYWDSSMSKKTPFVAEVVWANCQRVEDIELPESLLFCVDCEKPGLMSNTERLGDISDSIESWLPLDPMLYDFGYRQYVNILDDLAMKAEGKKTKMKLVDDTYIVPKGSGTNYSALKIKYRQKTGTFSGSFRIYSVKIDDESGESHLKKTKVPFHGAIADGRGWGFGHVKKIGSQPITLEDPAYSNRATRVDGTMMDLDAEKPDDPGEPGGDGDEGEASDNP